MLFPHDGIFNFVEYCFMSDETFVLRLLVDDLVLHDFKNSKKLEYLRSIDSNITRNGNSIFLAIIKWMYRMQ